MEHYFGKSLVKGKVKSIPISNRITPDLIIGGTYYVSFGRNIAYICTLLEIINEFQNTEVKILRQGKTSKITNKMDGTKSRYFTRENILYAYQIGISPEDAILNQV